MSDTNKKEPSKTCDTEKCYTNALLSPKQIDRIAKETARQVMLEIEAKESWKRNLGGGAPTEPHSITITRASNGFIVRDNYSDISYGEVIEEEDCFDSDKAETGAMMKLLYLVKELFGTFGGKYDDHKIYILDLPGQDNKKFTKKMSDVVWPEDKTCDCGSDTCDGECDCDTCDRRDTCNQKKEKDEPKE